jgi:hypothetical protein
MDGGNALELIYDRNVKPIPLQIIFSREAYRNLDEVARELSGVIQSVAGVQTSTVAERPTCLRVEDPSHVWSYSVCYHGYPAEVDSGTARYEVLDQRTPSYNNEGIRDKKAAVIRTLRDRILSRLPRQPEQ